MAQVFLVVSAFDQKYWLGELIGHVLDAFDHVQTDVVLKRPRRDYDRRGVVHHLRRVLARRPDYAGGVIMPTNPDHMRVDLAEFCAEFAQPVVFVDLEPFPTEADYPPGTAFIGYSPGAIGEAAARWLLGTLTRRDPFVLVIASTEHPGRQEVFVATLRAALPESTVLVDDTCAFHRAAALNAVRARLLGGHRPDAIFCTNDEMALGAVDALRWEGVTDTVVVGVDGIVEACAQIDTGTGPLRATVCQDGYEIAEGAVELLHRLRAAKPVPIRTFLPPRVHANRTRESSRVPHGTSTVHNETHNSAAAASLGSANNVWIVNHSAE